MHGIQFNKLQIILSIEAKIVCDLKAALREYRGNWKRKELVKKEYTRATFNKNNNINATNNVVAHQDYQLGL